ncbi:thiamine biosynthesis lipoprotein [Pedobacter rhizosphaerae]|uniref:FAD:protein FMN transferase n=2 Tax=Pedobacter rhizosphaerae TaxID=390241 RepID=A0A1H9K103_9SPHI|nr:thiamine biosynthesis lipoprotein [Pedobacter rhizosphaerae]
MYIRYLILFIPFFMAFFFKEEFKPYKISGYAQGTDYTITYYARDSIVTQKGIDSLLDVIDQSMSLYKKESLISRFNASNKGIQVDELMANVLKRSFEINQDTKGIFDITVAPLVQIWGFGPKQQQQEPDSAAIKQILKNVGMQYIHMDKNHLRKAKAEIKIDLNGIAQGYSVDLIAQYLEQKGIKTYLAELGGEIRVTGRKPDGSLMKIGIEGPDENGVPGIRHIASLDQGAITTSGNYRKFHQNGNKKITHLINPKTGYPLDNEMISVTVYAQNAITADGYDNTLMAMSLEEALAFVSKRKYLEAYFVYHRKDGTVADTLTTGFKKLLTDPIKPTTTP